MPPGLNANLNIKSHTISQQSNGKYSFVFVCGLFLTFTYIFIYWGNMCALINVLQYTCRRQRMACRSQFSISSTSQGPAEPSHQPSLNFQWNITQSLQFTMSHPHFLHQKSPSLTPQYKIILSTEMFPILPRFFPSSWVFQLYISAKAMHSKYHSSKFEFCSFPS